MTLMHLRRERSTAPAGTWRLRAILLSLPVGAASVTGCGSGDSRGGTYDCSVFPPAATSPYVLPWVIGTTRTANPHAARGETGPQKYSLDIRMPIGTEILAMRAGVVVRVEEAFVDGDNVYRHENYIWGRGLPGWRRRTAR